MDVVDWSVYLFSPTFTFRNIADSFKWKSIIL